MKNFCTILLAFVLALYGHAQDIPPKPEPARHVNDYAHLLQDYQKELLEQKLKNYQDTTSNQVVVAIIETLNGYDVESFANAMARQWGIGQKDKNNGILILIAKIEHKTRIEVGYGLEATVTDLASKEILRDIFKPNFKNGNFYAGIDQGIDRIILLASGQYQAQPEGKGGSGWIFLAIVLGIIVLSIFSKLQRVRRSHMGGQIDWWTAWTIADILRSGGSWGGGGGSDSGGWDFGGGDFGGGGASGDW